ncbi:MAG: phenylalanine--tRNA ligase subunit beta [Gemmatimonadales bacterium]
MNASLRWLSELLGTALDARDVRDRLTMLGAPVDAMETRGAGLEAVVVGLVLEAKKHPNADRLTLTRVDAGGPEPLSVVCGAPNVTAGRKYPFAPVGAVLPGGIKLERRKIRGEVSEGMLCSARELGLGEDGAGIMEITTDAAPGTRFLDVMKIADTRYEVDVTPNRPDLLSHEGLARDLGAVLGRPVKLAAIQGAPATPKVARAKGSAGQVAGVNVTIEDLEGCPRYCVAVIKGVRIGESPDWLKQRLADVGSRSISNVVDATNMLMLENGQPLHAFDLAKIAGSAILVRKSKAGEMLVTLDGQTRKLPAETCVIADSARASALGGIMGGKTSEIGAGTTDILLECACFDPKRTRRSRRALGMSTDASYRFERGVDHDATAERLVRAAQLIVAVAGGTIEGCLDVYPEPKAPRTIFLTDAKLTRVLGVDVARADVERSLTAIGCVVGPKKDRYAVQVPAWRPDLEREIDLVEEVARIVGYDRFPDEIRPYRPGTVPDAPSELLADRLRVLLTGFGMHEAVTLSLGPKVSDVQPAVLNPLSQGEAYLRHDLLAGLARRVEHNWRQMTRDVRLFEIGHVFDKTRGARRERVGEKEHVLPGEENRVAGVITGARRPPHWSEPEPPDSDLFDVKAALEAVVALARAGASIAETADGFTINDGGAVVGRAHALTADRPAWAAPVYGFELTLKDETVARARRAVALSEWPAIERDVALVLRDGVRAGDVERTLREAAGALLERLWAFDEYRGSPLAAGERSVAWRMVFRAGDRTLREEEADQAMAKAVKAVQEAHGVRRREA